MSHFLAVPRALMALGALSTLLYAVTVIPPISRPGGDMTRYLVVFPLIFGVYVAAVWLVLRRPGAADRLTAPRSPTLLRTIIAFGLLFRVLLLPTPVYLSSDLYRYLWDGRVQLAGINPYRYPPAAPELAALRDELHAGINRPASRSIYPPGAQWIFALSAAAGVRTVLAWRVVILAAEAATVALLLVLLRGLRLAETAVLVYVWSPLVVFEGVQGGHVDLLMVPLVLLALLWRREGKGVRAGLALGLAVLIKLYPVVLALAWSATRASALSGLESDGDGGTRHAAGRGAGRTETWQPGREGARWIVSWWRSRDWRFVGAVGATIALGYAPYVWTVGGGALGFLPEYFGSAEDHNVGLRALLTHGLGLTGESARAAVMTLLFLVLLGVLVWLGRTSAAPSTLPWTGAAAIAAYLLLVPMTMHPWYVVWMVPFLCFAPSPAWLYFSGAVSLSYVAYLVHPAPLPAWAWLAQYGPLVGLLAVEAWRSHARRAVWAAPRTT